MKFDAYAGNIYGGTRCSEVAELVGIATQSRVERGRPKGRHSDVFELDDGAQSVGWVGFDQLNDSAYFEFKGLRTPESVVAIRRHWSDQHSVSRFDTCEDYDDPEAFDSLTRVIDASTDPRVVSDIIAPRNGDRGRTIYHGSPKSHFRTRLYEAGKMKDRLHYGKPHWVRAEAQVRPGKAAEKKHASTVTALDGWGFSAWGKRTAETLSGLEVPRFAPPSMPATYDKTTLYVARTFKRHFEEMLLDFGSWECIGREFAAIWRDDAEALSSIEAAIKRGQGR
jgi:hypothetical protein